MNKLPIPEWLRSIKPPVFCENNTASGKAKSDSRIKLAGIPKQFQTDVSMIVDKQLPDLTHFAEFRREWHKEKRSVLITGPPGTGKSTMAAWACMRTIKSGGYVQWVYAYHMPDYLQQRKDHDPRRVLYHAERAPLVVIDDLHKLTGAWANERMQLCGIIHMRHAMELPTIAISTWDKDKLGQESDTKSGGMFAPDTMDRFPWNFKTDGESVR